MKKIGWTLLGVIVWPVQYLVISPLLLLFHIARDLFAATVAYSNDFWNPLFWVFLLVPHRWLERVQEEELHYRVPMTPWFSKKIRPARVAPEPSVSQRKLTRHARRRARMQQRRSTMRKLGR